MRVGHPLRPAQPSRRALTLRGLQRKLLLAVWICQVICVLATPSRPCPVTSSVALVPRGSERGLCKGGRDEALQQAIALGNKGMASTQCLYLAVKQLLSSIVGATGLLLFIFS